MESRIAVAEAEIRNLKENVAELFDRMKTLDDAVTRLLTGQAELKGEIKTLRVEMRAPGAGLASRT